VTVPRQLEMRRRTLEDLPEIQLSPGCELRSYQHGDEEHWARIMNHCIGTKWTAERCLAELVQRAEFDPEGCLFAVVEGLPQGTATAWQKAELRGDTGYLHMVGVAPDFRGRGLGHMVTLAALRWFREQGYRRVILHTDGWRLPAIRTYLRLGFQPVLFNDEHTHRWEAVRSRLSPQRPDSVGALDDRSP